MFSDGPGSTLVVTGQHDDLDPHVLQLPHRLGGVFLDHIRDGDDSGQAPVLGKEQRRFPLCGKPLTLRPQLPARCRRIQMAQNIGLTPALQELSVQCCREAVARQSPEV